MLDDTLQLLEPQLRRSQIEIVRDYAQDLPQVHGNSVKLQQVFTNLILNARDSIANGNGRITLATRNGDDDGLLVEVADNGVGIAPDDIVKIYDPFFTTKGVGRGTGLGLAVTYGIVQEHSGHISVSSTPGLGTTFRITLPTSDPRRPAAGCCALVRTFIISAFAIRFGNNLAFAAVQQWYSSRSPAGEVRVT